MVRPDVAEMSLECVRRSEEHAELHPPQLKNFIRLNSTTLDEIRQRKGEPPDAVPSPFPTLNRLCLGAGGRIGPAHGTQLLIAGSSNVGKSHVAYNLAIAAMRSAENVAFIALEADTEDIATRLAASVSGTPIEFLSRGKQFDVEQDAGACKVLTDLPGGFYVNQEPIYRLEEIEAAIEALHRLHDCRTFIVDHLQLASSGTDKRIYDRVTEISHVTRTLAVRHRLLSIGVSQINRMASRDRERCVSIYDLQGGSTLENDAGLVLLVDKCSTHYRYDLATRTASTQLIVGKNRFGPVGVIPILFEFKTAQVRELLPDEEDGR
ncbi:MAG: DnaB-like helicase C-terminal domain-containing protein [Gemmatimonadota bacterium]